MIKKAEYDLAVKRTLDAFADAGIILTDEEKKKIEVADFGLGRLEEIGLEILTYINTERVCAKEMVLFPNQTCPEHRHIGTADRLGKQETFRVRRGKVFLYVPGEGKAEDINGKMPSTKVHVFHEIALSAGEQYTLYPDTWHWFQAGKEGAIVSEFSTMSTDETDVFFDEAITRAPEVE